jgi:general secretion pathway protein K
MHNPGHITGSEKGLALITTLLITVILIILVVELVYAVFIATSRTYNFRDSQRAALLADTGVDVAMVKLEEFIKANPNMVMGEGGVTFNMREGDGLLEINVSDEQGKISLNIVYPDTGVKKDKVYSIYSRLLEVLDKEEYLAETLADWIDADDEPRMNGAEGIDHYQRLASPYTPKNDYLSSVDELMMVKDYTSDVYTALAPHVTVYSGQSGEPLINVNTANKTVIMALSDDMTEDLAQRIIEYRKETPFKNVTDIKKIPGVDFDLNNIMVTSNIYRLRLRAMIGDTVREVEAVVQIGKGVLYWREM